MRAKTSPTWSKQQAGHAGCWFPAWPAVCVQFVDKGRRYVPALLRGGCASELHHWGCWSVCWAVAAAGLTWERCLCCLRITTITQALSILKARCSAPPPLALFRLLCPLLHGMHHSAPYWPWQISANISGGEQFVDLLCLHAGTVLSCPCWRYIHLQATITKVKLMCQAPF
jgi:hypothetical protein